MKNHSNTSITMARLPREPYVSAFVSGVCCAAQQDRSIVDMSMVCDVYAHVNYFMIITVLENPVLNSERNQETRFFSSGCRINPFKYRHCVVRCTATTPYLSPSHVYRLRETVIVT